MPTKRPASRKLWFSVYAITMLVATAAAAAIWVSFAVTYETLAGSIVAVTALYLTGNVAQKVGFAKVTASLHQAPPTVYADEADEPLSPPASRFTED